MNEDLNKIVEFVEGSKNLSDEEKTLLKRSIKIVEKELAITAFKLERTEKVKKTTSILLEETIEELELKRKAVEEQAELIKIENERKTIELEEARKLQLAMLPKELPKLPNLDIAVYMQTATEVGGDYYDFFVDDEGILTAVVGDATGHGMKAGTIVTITKSQFNSLASSEDILNTFSKISDVIKDMHFRQLSMCMTMIKLHGNKLALSSAAMPPTLIYRKSTKEVEEIEMKGMPLGAMRDFPYVLHQNRIETGDTILLLTDGLPELQNRNYEMYGYEKIKSEFAAIGEKKPEEIVDHFKNSASAWVNDKDPDDDVTFVVIKVK